MREMIQTTLTAMSEKVGNENFLFISLSRKLNTYMALTVAAGEELEEALNKAKQFDNAMSFTCEFFLRMAQEGFDYKGLKKVAEDTFENVLTDAFKNDKDSLSYLREEKHTSPMLLVALFINIYITVKGQ